MTKKVLLFLAIAALFSISCSDSDKFNANNKSELEFEIFCDTLSYRNKPYIRARTNLSLKDDEEYYYCYWMIDEERFSNQGDFKKVSYGEHILKFVLIDMFGDTLSKSKIIRINEPLKITLLSPIDNYEAAITDIIKFQYKISGVDAWEQEPEKKVYFSIDNEEWKLLEDDFLPPPFYWKVKADSVFSEIRSVWIKN